MHFASATCPASMVVSACAARFFTPSPVVSPTPVDITGKKAPRHPETQGQPLVHRHRFLLVLFVPTLRIRHRFLLRRTHRRILFLFLL